MVQDLYRRYPDKASLVAASVDRRSVPAPSPRLDSPLISTHGAGLLNAMFTAMRSDPALADSMRRILNRDTDEFTALLCSDIKGKEPLSPRAAALIGEVAPAMIVRRVTVVGLPVRPSLSGLLR